MIAIESALVVLRRGKRDRGLAVAEREKRGFLPVQKFLHHHLRAGRTEGAAKHHVDRRLRLGHGGGDDHALAGGEPVGLDDDRRALRAHVALRRIDRAEALIGGGGNGVRLAQILGEAFGAFEPRRRARRAKRLDAGGGEIVDHPGAERRLGSDHDQVDLLRPAKRDDRCVVGEVERDQLAFAGNAGVARRAVEPIHERARGKLPGERVLASTRTEEKNLHACAAAIAEAIFGGWCSMAPLHRKGSPPSEIVPRATEGRRPA